MLEKAIAGADKAKSIRSQQPIGLRVTTEVHERLRHIAEVTGLSVSAVIREGIKLVDNEFTKLYPEVGE